MLPNAAAAPTNGTALLLTGGGARGAYQVGVLRGIAEIFQSCRVPSPDAPFDIIVGTSAGAINAAALACYADDFCKGTEQLEDVWSHFHAADVYRSGVPDALGAGFRLLAFMLFGWLSPGIKHLQPHSLLDNTPLRQLLDRRLPLDRIPLMLEEGHLRAVAITASCYSSGEHLTFYDGVDEIQDWQRERRRAVRTRIRVDHLMASAAIPFVFPAVQIEDHETFGYYGDGSMRQTAPIAPVIHLGAKRVLVIGVGQDLEPMDATSCVMPEYPTLAQVGNHALASIFLDTLASDAALLRRVNRVLDLIPPALRDKANLHPVDLHVIMPSQRLDQIAARHTHTLPFSVRTMMGALGMRGGSAALRSSALASYLLFEPEFTKESIALGRADALAQRDALLEFFAHEVGGAAHEPARPATAART